MKAFFLILLLASAPVFAQCEREAPELRGVRLGMSTQDVIAHLGKPFKQDDQHLGYWPAKATVDWASKIGNSPRPEIPAHFEGVDQMTIGLAANKVTSIMIDYKLDDPKWKSPEEFAITLSEKLNLPRNWTYTDNAAELICRSWHLTADSKNNRITLQSVVIGKKKDFRP